LYRIDLYIKRCIECILFISCCIIIPIFQSWLSHSSNIFGLLIDSSKWIFICIRITFHDECIHRLNLIIFNFFLILLPESCRANMIWLVNASLLKNSLINFIVYIVLVGWHNILVTILNIKIIQLGFTSTLTYNILSIFIWL